MASLPRKIESFVFHKKCERNKKYVKTFCEEILESPIFETSLQTNFFIHNLFTAVRLNVFGKSAHANIPKAVKRQFVPSDDSSQATIRPKFQKATIRPKRQFVPF